jgi:hypothetical protein
MARLSTSYRETEAGRSQSGYFVYQLRAGGTLVRVGASERRLCRSNSMMVSSME